MRRMSLLAIPFASRSSGARFRSLLRNSGRRAIDFGRDFEENLPS